MQSAERQFLHVIRQTSLQANQARRGCGRGLAWALTVVVDGVGDDGLDGVAVMAALVLEEHLDAETHHVQVVLLSLHQLLLGHCKHRATRTEPHGQYSGGIAYRCGHFIHYGLETLTHLLTHPDIDESLID